MTKEEKKETKALATKELHEWFITEIWNKRPHYSELSGVWLGKEPKPLFFHHIFSKSKYPELRLNSENILMVTGQEHHEIENGKVPEKLKIILKIKGKKFGIVNN